VVDDPGKVLFRVVGDPVPAPFVGVDPAAVCVRPPVGRPALRNPDLAPARISPPLAVRLERRAEID
jgi:hypothetical protein